MEKILSFGPFRLDPIRRQLWKSGEPLELTAKELQLLLVLASRGGTVVPSKNLLDEVWPGTTVEPNNLAQTVRRLRRKMGKNEAAQDYIRTVAREGYTLAASVSSAPARDEIAARAGTAAPSGVRSVRVRREILVAAVLCAAAVLVLAGRAGLRPGVAITSIEQLTFDGHLKNGPVFTDGKRVYFQETLNGSVTPVSIPIDGGPIESLNVPEIRDPHLLDMRADPLEFLVAGWDGRGSIRVWEWQPGKSARPLTSNYAESAAWISESTLLFAHKTRIAAASRERPEAVTTEIVVPGWVQGPRWSAARGLLRFTLLDPKTQRTSMWQVRGLNSQPEQVSGYPDDSGYGTWSQDGSLFVFSVRTDGGWDIGGRDIWVEDFRMPLPGLLRKPVRLTHGPVRYQWVAPSVDGRRVFALGDVTRNELVRYDLGAHRFVSFTPELAAVEADYSRDGEWVTYAAYPQRSLWKMKSDGSNRVQLTDPPLTVIQPHWSPDGSRIAFMGQHPGKPMRIYIISSDGGTAEEVTRYPRDQGVPTWSADGTRLVFGELLNQRPANEMAIHILDLSSGQVSTLPGSYGLFTPRWSPDGGAILAHTPDFHTLSVFDCSTSVWRELTRFPLLDHPMWTADSSHIYFWAAGAPGGAARPSNERAIYRIHAKSGRLERVADLTGFPPGDISWFGVAPDGSPLALRGALMQQLYALKLRR